MALALGGESAPSASLGEYGNVRARDGAQPDESLLESAASLAPARDPVGAWARYLLVAALWGEDRDKVLSYLDELLPTPAPEIAPFVDELRYRRAMLLADGVQADHQAALAALDAIDPDDRHGDIGRDDVILGRLMAAYRSGDLPRTVSLASEAYRPREATVGADHAARRAADLRIAFGGVLPPYAPATALDKISSHGVERIVADCVERLGIERAGLDRAPPLLYAAVTVRLTLRALHRGDRQAARDYLALAQARVREQAPLRATVDELASLLRGGELDEPAREALRGKLKSFGAVDPMTAGVLAALGSPTPPSIEEQEVDEVLDPDDEPTAERRFAALVRLCLEPAHWRVDTSDETRLEVVLSVYQRHPPEVKMQTNGLVADELESCMQQQVASLYAQSPSSVHASIDLSGVHDRPEAPAPYGIMGVMSGGGLGDAGLGDIGAIGGLGSGGLGLRGTGLGGGGSGGSVGIGTIGTIGRGGGGRIAVGGAGAASARVSGPPPAKAPSAKAPGKGTGTPKKPKPASGPPPRAGK